MDWSAEEFKVVRGHNSRQPSALGCTEISARNRHAPLMWASGSFLCWQQLKQEGMRETVLSPRLFPLAGKHDISNIHVWPSYEVFNPMTPHDAISHWLRMSPKTDWGAWSMMATSPMNGPDGIQGANVVGIPRPPTLWCLNLGIWQTTSAAAKLESDAGTDPLKQTTIKINCDVNKASKDEASVLRLFGSALIVLLAKIQFFIWSEETRTNKPSHVLSASRDMPQPRI